MDTLKGRARSAIARRDFKEAETLLYKAIQTTIMSPDLELYDMRAAVFEKLGQLSHALSDSKQMLQLDLHDARGYLRAGKIYQLLDKDLSALECYRRGCKSVPASAPLYKVLKQLLKVVDTRINAQVVRRDPFTVLPLELIGEVFAYLSFPAKLRCLNVSRHWSTVLTSDSRFYARLDLLTNARRKPKVSNIEAYIKKSRGRLEHLMTNVNLSADSLRFHLKFCKDLTILCIPFQRSLLHDLSKAKALQRLTLTDVDESARPLSFREAIFLIQQFKYLTHFKAQTYGNATVYGDENVCNPQMANLRILELDVDHMITTRDLFECRDRRAMVKLRTLNLSLSDRLATGGLLVDSEVSWPTELQSLKGKIYQDVDRANILLPASLRELDLHMTLPVGHCSPVPSGPIKYVTIRHYAGGVTASEWQALLSQARTFRMVDATMTELYLELSLMCNSLEELVLSSHYVSTMQDHELKVLIKDNLTLKRLNLTNFKSITGHGLATCVRALPQLIELNIDGCDQIDNEVVRWIRSRGVRVKQTLTS